MSGYCHRRFLLVPPSHYTLLQTNSVDGLGSDKSVKDPQDRAIDFKIGMDENRGPQHSLRSYPPSEHCDRQLAILNRQRSPIEVAELNNQLNSLQSILTTYGFGLNQEFEPLGELSDINKAIQLHQEIVSLIPNDNTDKPLYLNNLGILLSRRFADHGELTDINEAIKAVKQAATLTADNHAAKPAYLGILGGFHFRRFKRLREQEDINESIEMLGKAISLAPENHNGLLGFHSNLGTYLLHRFLQFGQLADIDKAAELHRHVVSLTSDGNVDMPARLGNLADTLSYRFGRLGQLADIELAIESLRQAIYLTPENHPVKPGLFSNLGASLLRRFERLEELADVNESIEMMILAISLTPENDLTKPDYLNNLGKSLSARFVRLGELTDINRAIEAFEKADSFTPHGHVNKPKYLASLGISLSIRFRHYQQPADIDRAINIQRQVVSLVADGHVAKLVCLSNLANSLVHRFEWLGELADIDLAILTLRQAVSLAPDSHPAKPAILNSLGNALRDRATRLGELEDINESIEVMKQAISLIPNGHAKIPLGLITLGHALHDRFKRLGDLDDIREAIGTVRQAISLVPDGHADKRICLSSLGDLLHSRFDRLEKLEDINEAIDVQRQAITLTPDGHSMKPMLLNNLGNSLCSRFKRSSDADLADINEGIGNFERAVSLTPDGHFDKPSWLNNLGISLKMRFECLGIFMDLKNAIEAFKSAAYSPTGSPQIRFSTSCDWANLSETVGDKGLDAYQVLMDLLPQIAWLGSSVRRRFHYIRESLGDYVNRAASAAIRAEDYELATEWLEQGRSIIWGQLLNLRTPLDDLRAVDNTLAHELEQVSQQLEIAGNGKQPNENSLTSEVPLEQQAIAHRQLAQKWEELIEQIRNLPGFEKFLKPKKYSELSEAARHHPVAIINISLLRCDALILGLSNSVSLVPLNELSQEKATKLHSRLFDLLQLHKYRARKIYPAPLKNSQSSIGHILEVLWSLVVHPILRETGYKETADNCLPHITWCPTGPLTFLPLHAAGTYGSEKCISVSNFAISSYVPTLTTLLVRQSKHTHGSISTRRGLIISQPNTPLLSGLSGTVEEADCVRKYFNGLHLNHEQATVSAVLQELKAHAYVHLACHGMQNLDDPLRSSFALYDGMINLQMLMNNSLENARLAFLSACQTATGDKGLPDEAVHLASGMLASGYASVIGTMWPIRDSDGPLVADAFYASFFEESADPDGHRPKMNTAYALHNAVRRLRDEIGDTEFMRWVPFVHFGI